MYDGDEEYYMKDDNDTWFCFCLGIILMGIISGCFMSDDVAAEEWTKGEEFCASNGGLTKVKGYFMSQDFICKNGAVFNLKAKF
jgi:hypothetical protein